MTGVDRTHETRPKAVKRGWSNLLASRAWQGEPMERVTSTDGTTIAFARQGTGDPVLLVHGTTSSSAGWALVAPHLEERFTVVTMDRRGRGGSSDGVEYSLDLEAADVAAVVEAIGGLVHVVGHSYGARAALLAATRGPGVRSLVLYEPPLAPQHFPADLPDRAESLVRAGDPAAAAALFFLESGAATAEEFEFLKSFPPAWERILAGIPTAPRELRALVANPVDIDAVRRIGVPVLTLLGGETTHPVFGGLEALERALPDVRRATIAGQRHLAAGFAPEAFAERVKSFLLTVGEGSKRPAPDVG